MEGEEERSKRGISSNSDIVDDDSSTSSDHDSDSFSYLISTTTISNGLVSMRNTPPADYTLKIERFSFLLQATQTDFHRNYISSIFETRGYRWRLYLYPNGDKENNGQGYISLYLVASDTNRLPSGWEVNVDFKLFVYNQLSKEYYTVQDGEGKLARFNQMKTKNGFPRLISQAVFNDSSNGYIVDDTCIFGAEVFVIRNNTRKVESLSAAGYRNHPIGVYTWIVSDFSNMNLERDHWSPVFSAAGKKWKIRISSTEKRGKKYLLLGLYLANTQTNFLDFNFLSSFRRHNREAFSRGGDFYVEYIIRVRDQLYEEHIIGKVCCWFYVKSSNAGNGFNYFVPLEDLKDPTEGFLLNDSVVIDVEFNLIREVKNILYKAPFDNKM